MLLRALLQEAQQDTIMSFERYMNDCMTRDWATDKQGLFSSVAPYTGLGGAAAAGGLSFGSIARADVGERNLLPSAATSSRCCVRVLASSSKLLSPMHARCWQRMQSSWQTCAAEERWL